jgi:predicted Co/Zn/Cd cation transporter (cation efflux family)
MYNICAQKVELYVFSNAIHRFVSLTQRVDQSDQDKRFMMGFWMANPKILLVI